jgi:hypothetical protein
MFDPGNFFTSTRAAARVALTQCFDNAGWHCRSLRNPQATGPGGEPVTLEVGWIGPHSASSVLVSLSGTHGLEAHAGAAAQLGFAHRLAAGGLPDDVAVLFLHGFNGFGWEHGSRSNESNVDLNRNMVDFAAPLPANPLYGSVVHELFAPRSLSADPVAQMHEHIETLCQRHGRDAVFDAINRGQYSHADGVYYGGRQREWSGATLQHILETYLPSAKRVACIDWHTGMGDFGDTFFICFHNRALPKFRRACDWWGEAKLLDESGFADAPRPAYSGIVMNSIEQTLERRGCETIGAVIEFGTYDPDRVETGILIDRAMRFGGATVPPARAASLREQMLETFNPDSRAWRDSVAAKSSAIYESALTGLAEWSASAR